MHYETVIFDLGGTLLDYRGPVSDWPAMERLGLSAVYQLLSSNGHTPPAEEEFCTHCFNDLKQGWYAAVAGERNLQLEALLHDAVVAQGLRIDPALLHQAVERYTSAISAGARPRPGTAETLAALKAQGRRLGLISNTMWPPAAHTADLERFGLARHFDALFYSAEQGHWKPGSRIFEIALEALGGVAERAVFVGDNPHDDVSGAHGAGMRAVWLRHAEYAPDAGAAADAIIDSLPELLDVLAQWEIANSR